MRFYRKLGAVRLVARFAVGALLGGSFLRQGYSFWAAVLAGILFVLAWLPSWLFWYWEIGPDCVTQRRYFGRTIFPFSTITYAGPVTGNLAGRRQTRNWIEIRTDDGRWMIVDAADPDGFLARMREYLPTVTLNR